ncbi:MAG: hypothetical protein M0O96_09970 [Desulforhopalus sp.]|nr:hypothetical protein [Desulforhopalus sp.]
MARYISAIPFPFNALRKGNQAKTGPMETIPAMDENSIPESPFFLPINRVMQAADIYIFNKNIIKSEIKRGMAICRVIVFIILRVGLIFSGTIIHTTIQVAAAQAGNIQDCSGFGKGITILLQKKLSAVMPQW